MCRLRGRRGKHSWIGRRALRCMQEDRRPEGMIEAHCLLETPGQKSAPFLEGCPLYFGTTCVASERPRDVGKTRGTGCDKMLRTEFCGGMSAASCRADACLVFVAGGGVCLRVR